MTPDAPLGSTVSTRRAFLRRGFAAVGASALASTGVGADLRSGADDATRHRLRVVTAGAVDRPSSVRFEFLENDTVTDPDDAARVFDHLVSDVLRTFVESGTIAGFSAVHYRDDLPYRDHDRTTAFDYRDVWTSLADAGWNDPDVLSLAYVGRADVWNWETARFQNRRATDGAAVLGSYHDPAANAVAWKAQHRPAEGRDHVRRAAHGAAMELLHALVDHRLLEGSEHQLGGLIEEYNDFYGHSGRFASPLAAGPATWASGPCRTDDDPTYADADGVTFTMTPCTRRAVAETVAHHVE